jgi:hypothetical protein
MARHAEHSVMRPVDRLRPPWANHPGEEVQRQDALGLRSQELSPARAVPARRRVDPGTLEDLPDRGRRYRDAEVGQFAVDPAVTPRLVFSSQPQHHRPDITAHRWPAGSATARQARHRRRRVSRCQRKMVPGVTMSRIAAKRSMGSVPASSQPRPVWPRQPGLSPAAVHAGRRQADGAASRSRRPSTTTPVATGRAAIRHRRR